MRMFSFQQAITRLHYKQARQIHTLKEVQLSLSEPNSTSKSNIAMSLSLNINDRQSRMTLPEYSKHCMQTHLPMLIKPFQAFEEKTSLCLVIAESTVFIKNAQTGKFRARGGHILAIELIAPPRGHTTPPTIVNIISKLPGQSPSRTSNAQLQDGNELERQAYEVPAHYEDNNNVILYRDSNSSIDLDSNIVAPVYVGIIDLSRVSFDFRNMIINAKKIQEKDKIYKRIGAACGEFLIECYDDKLLGGRTGMSTQNAFDLFFTSIIEGTKDKKMIDLFQSAKAELKFGLNPIDMLSFGLESREKYRQTVSKEDLLDSTNVEPPLNSSSGGKKP
jgi:hypothetical protein